MSAWIATTLIFAIAAVAATATANAGSCGPKNPYHCTDNGQNLDFNSAPDIAKKIVGEEPVIQKQSKPIDEPVASAPYTGPIFGATVGSRTPTVGYSWSLH